MSWAEEQSWFGLEPEDIENISTIHAERVRNLLNKGYWECKNHTKVKIKEMSDTHLKNSINKIKRENWRVFALPYLEKEMNKRIKLI